VSAQSPPAFYVLAQVARATETASLQAGTANHGQHGVVEVSILRSRNKLAFRRARRRERAHHLGMVADVLDNRALASCIDPTPSSIDALASITNVRGNSQPREAIP
jgi:hypothetical protein